MHCDMQIFIDAVTSMEKQLSESRGLYRTEFMRVD